MRKVEQMSSASLLTAVLFYGVLGVGCFLYLSSVLMTQPLFPFQMQNLAWTQEWLLMTVLDYYGGVLPLCGIVLASEGNRIVALAWVVAILLLGSPFACAWVVWRLLKHQTLRMMDAETLVLSELASD